jgi:hypothetical protein
MRSTSQPGAGAGLRGLQAPVRQSETDWEALPELTGGYAVSASLYGSIARGADGPLCPRCVFAVLTLLRLLSAWSGRKLDRETRDLASVA